MYVIGSEAQTGLVRAVLCTIRTRANGYRSGTIGKSNTYRSA